MATRICKLNSFHNFVGGKDNDNVFEEGVIYSVLNIAGEILLTPIGKQSKYDKYGNEFIKKRLDEIITTGDYLLTADELKKSVK